MTRPHAPRRPAPLRDAPERQRTNGLVEVATIAAILAAGGWVGAAIAIIERCGI